AGESRARGEECGSRDVRLSHGVTASDRAPGTGADIARVSDLKLERTRSAPLDTATLDRLWHELGQLKDETLTRFARGEMANEAMLTSFLTDVHDAPRLPGHSTSRARVGAPGGHT